MKVYFGLILLFSFTLTYSQFPGYKIKSDSINNYLNENNQDYIGDNSVCLTDTDTKETKCQDQFSEYTESIKNNEIIATYSNGKVKSITKISGINKTVTIYYFNSTQMFMRREYKNGMLWNIEFYNKKGIKLNSGSFSNGQGELKYYRQNNSISMISHFTNGKTNGLVKLLYSNGSTMALGQCKNGEKSGVWKEYWTNGTLLSNTTF